MFLTLCCEKYKCGISNLTFQLMHENILSKIILDKAFIIHKALGPGLLESVYETILAYELSNAGMEISRQKAIPVIYNN